MAQIKKLFLLIVVFVLLVTLLPANALAIQNTISGQDEKVIVLFKDKADKNTILNAKGKISHEFKSINAISATINSKDIESLMKDPKVVLIEKDLILKKSAQTADWGIKDIQAPTAWNTGYTGSGVKIAVLDTGIAPHPDLAIAGGYSAVDYTTSYNDDDGHGTHVAGIIGARNNDIGVVGVAYDSSLYAVKVLDNTGSGYLSDIIEGIDWSISHGMSIINMSLGTSSYSSIFEVAVNEAYNNGILVVAAAGNSGNAGGKTDTVEYPAKFDSAIAVAAVDSSNTRANFSSTGSQIEVAAPGVSVLSTYNDGRYVYMSGTSMATPYATGTLAILKQANPTATSVELRSKFQSFSKDLGVVGRDTLYGYGLIQATQNTSTVTPTPTPIKKNPKK